jgi:hypothetical protein
MGAAGAGQPGRRRRRINRRRHDVRRTDLRPDAVGPCVRTVLLGRPDGARPGRRLGTPAMPRRPGRRTPSSTASPGCSSPPCTWAARR